MTQQINLDEIEARANAATPGPWKVYEVTNCETMDEEVVSRGIENAAGGINGGDEYELYSLADAAFIAHAREDVPALVQLARAQQARIDELADALDSLLDGLDANYDERCGLTSQQWNARVRAVRAVAEKVA